MSKIWAEWDPADFEMLLNKQNQPHENHHAHRHGRLRSFTVKLDKPFTQDKLDNLIARCKSGVFGSLCRVKGIVIAESHFVLLNIALQDVTLKTLGGVFEPALTFIGQTVNKSEILNSL